MEKLAFGELEFSILQIVVKLGRVTVREVYGALGQRRSYTTVMTVMSRLVEKGELKREKVGKQYIYWTSTQSQSSASRLLNRIKNKIFAIKPLALVSYLLENDLEFTEEDFKEIEKLIEKRRNAYRDPK